MNKEYALFKHLGDIAKKYSKEESIKALIISDITAHRELKARHLDNVTLHRLYDGLCKHLSNEEGLPQLLNSSIDNVPTNSLAYIICQVLKRNGIKEVHVFDDLMNLDIPNKSNDGITPPIYKRITSSLWSKVGIFSNGDGKIIFLSLIHI